MRQYTVEPSGFLNCPLAALETSIFNVTLTFMLHIHFHLVALPRETMQKDLAHDKPKAILHEDQTHDKA